MTAAEGDWLTIAEVCAELRVTRATLYRWARQGKLRLHKLGSRATRVRRSELERLFSPGNGDMAWTALSERSFAEDWNSEEDAVYDNWRELYGVQAR
jgi:excisionase family DNA binding protein